jgi:hypothetical protein
VSKTIWITWEVHTRSRSISKILNLKLIELISNKNRFIKYITLSYKTISALKQHSPKVLIIQNPSIVLSYLTLVLKPFFKYKLIMDCHNAAIFPCEGKFYLLNIIARFLISKADFVIVTNTELANIVKKLNGSPITLNDPIPVFQYEKKSKPTNHKFKITLICTWAADEPVAEFLKAACKIENAEFYVTGKVKNQNFPQKYSHVNFPGFLSRDEYIKLIASSDLIVDLTTRENCLVCGGYEGVGVEVPLLLSKTESLQATFDYGVVFCENTESEITIGLQTAIESSEFYQEEIQKMKTIHMKRWEVASFELIKEIIL